MPVAMANDDCRLHAYVRGRVQGVGFRLFVRHLAVTLGLRGYVRNTGDGSVEVVAEGARSALLQLLAALQRGPSGARVRAVDEAWEAADGAFAGFQIRH